MRWFDRLPREDQAMVLAYDMLERDPHAGAKRASSDVLGCHLDRIERKKRGES